MYQIRTIESKCTLKRSISLYRRKRSRHTVRSSTLKQGTINYALSGKWFNIFYTIYVGKHRRTNVAGSRIPRVMRVVNYKDKFRLNPVFILQSGLYFYPPFYLIHNNKKKREAYFEQRDNRSRTVMPRNG